MRAEGTGFGVWGSGLFEIRLTVRGFLGFRLQGLGFRVPKPKALNPQP